MKPLQMPTMANRWATWTKSISGGITRPSELQEQGPQCEQGERASSW